jgi:hypothetical protein
VLVDGVLEEVVEVADRELVAVELVLGCEVEEVVVSAIDEVELVEEVDSVGMMLADELDEVGLLEELVV